MPGLKQLQQFNSDIMTLGDEVKIRAARGEKPVTVSIPKDVPDIDDSDEFLNGLPMLSEEEQAQADAAQKEREREANDFSEFLDDDKESSEEQEKSAPKQEAAVPDMSDLLPSGGDMDLGDFDLSDFEEKAPEPEEEPEPKEVAIEDMDLDSLLAFSETPKEEPEEEPSIFDPSDRPQKTIDTPTEDVSESIFDDTQVSEPETDSLFGNPGAQEPSNQAFDESLFDPPAENPEAAEPLPELDENSLMSSLGGIGEFNEVSEAENPLEEAPSLEEATEEIPSTEDAFNFELPAEPEETSTEESFTTDDEVSEGDSFDAGDFNFSLDADPAEDAVAMDAITAETEPLEEAIDLPPVEEISMEDAPAAEENGSFDADFEDPNDDFRTSESLSLNDDIPTEFNEIPDLANIPQEEEPEPAEEPAATETSAESFDVDSLGDLNDFNLPDADTLTDSPSDDFGTEDFSTDDIDAAPATENLSTDEFSTDGLDDLPDFGSDDSSNSAMDFGTDSMEIPSLDSFDATPAPVDSLSPEETVPEDSFDTNETFDTSDINGLDFSGEENSDFALGSIDGGEGDDEFSIPGFSDTVTANFDKKPQVATPDFSGAAEVDEKDKPKNTFTDAEYKRFLKNLATYPLNVRIALEDFVVKNEFTDDAIFAVLEKVLRKAPARQVATELEKLLDISLDVPRDFERRSAEEYEAYKKSIEYQLKNKIIPGAIMTAVAAVLVFCIFTLTNTFIYKPIRASNLYKQGYALLQDSQYPQSEERFNQALTFKPVKKWFYTYAEGYRDHRQYDRSRMMYKTILKRYDHEKKAGLDWARMESEDLYNYEESERILKREVLDYHINDADAILALGDLYLDWATDSNTDKYPLAKQNYDLLVELYGSNNLYLSRQMRYFIRTDNLRQVLAYKEMFMNQKKGLQSSDEIELSGYMLDKRFGKLRPSEENLRSQIEDVRKLLERALKSAPEDAVALYNMGRYFVETKSGKSAARLLQASIDSFEAQTRRNKRDTYKYINSYRLLGEEMRNEREYLTAETLYGRGIDIFERENASSRFESDENVGKLYADLADLDYFIAADNDAALMHYESAVNNKYDTSSVRYRIGYIQYQNQNYPAALGSFIKSHDTSGNDIHLLLALANTLSLSSDNYVARGYYERLISILEGERQKYGILFPQVRDDQGDIVDTYMKASNNLGVTLSRIASNTGDSSLNAKAIVNLQESLRAWDALTRNQTTMIRLEGSNLAEQNVRYITHPMPDYNPEIYTEIPRMLFGEEGLE
ncbi:periplasmic flagellar collar protein FlcA [Treponema sp.]|uniref:periplasmic flagellar collar protein FlcA n=1 Tax=Treponema sp. TaxID=166 RepID=UPI00298E8BD1|nr:hypothetical protein [Treponema sp.]MCQ2242179.1 hypothetical protein [Treponema sp.]